MYEEVPIEIVNIIKEKPVVAYKMMSDLTQQAMLLEGIKPTQQDIDLVIYQFMRQLSAKEVKLPKPEELN